MTDPLRDFHDAVHDALGYAPEMIEPGKLQRFATSPRRSDDAGWCRLFDDLRGGVFGCHRQGIHATWRAESSRPLGREQPAAHRRRIAAARTERDANQQRQWAIEAGRISRLWSECVPPVQSDPVALYLQNRGLGEVWPPPPALRLHRELPYWDGQIKLGTFPAMIAALTDPAGRTVALHRTYLTDDGRKADVPSVKKLTRACGTLLGACIALHSPADGLIGIAEGIETALGAACGSKVPTVAAYCASSLATWRWPPGVRRIVVFADNDPAGQQAARALRSRALSARVQCEIHTPSIIGDDWCDVWSTRDALSLTGAAA